MLFRVAILFLATFVARAIGQSSNNVFINPPPKGSGKSTQTWIAGQTYTLSWNTNYDDVVVFLQSAENGGDGNPRQSLTLLDAGSHFTTSPHSFLVGSNIDTSLSPFHFEVYQASTNHNFESQNVNILAKDSNGSSPLSGEEATTTVTRVSISTLVKSSPYTSATTVTVSDIATESITVTVSSTVQATIQATAQAANNPNTLNSGAAGGLSVLSWWLVSTGMAVGLDCVFNWI